MKLVDDEKLDTALTATADAIRAKTGSEEAIAWGEDGFAGAVEGIPKGGYSPDDDVCFWDYEGTLVYSCTLAQAQKMTELPEAPDHSGDDIPLTFVEWNWTLEEINALDRRMHIGAIYKPTDGKTHFSIRMTVKTGLEITIGWRNNTSTANRIIDWGDGTVEEIAPATDADATASHTYADYGTYHCTFDPQGCSWNPGNTSGFQRSGDRWSNCCFTGKLIWDEYADLDWPGSQTIGLEGATIDTLVGPCNLTGVTGNLAHGNYVRHYNQPSGYKSNIVGHGQCAKVVVPPNLTAVGDYAFAFLRGITELRIPKNISSIERFTFYLCTNLRTFTWPDNITSLSHRMFKECYALTEMKVPDTVTSILAEAFYNACGILDYYFYSVEPPTLASTDAFTGIKSTAIIHVPAESLEAYQTATNWATYADYMVGDL